MTFRTYQFRERFAKLFQQDVSLCYCPQNIIELWNVLTRPANRNGFGLSIAETEEEVRLIERTFTLLPDHEGIYTIWRRLVNEYDVRGRQVHDARLVAAMRFHGISTLLTLNRSDFLRYRDIRIVEPFEFGASI